MKFRDFIAYWFPIIVYMLLIFYLSSLANENFTGISEGLGINDKAEHFIEYFILSFLLLRLLIHYRQDYPSLKAVAISTLYGLTDEIHQLFVPTRVFSFNDLFFDFLGSLISIIIMLFFVKVIPGRKK